MLAGGQARQALAMQAMRVPRSPAVSENGIQCQNLLGQSVSNGRPTAPTLHQLQQQVDRDKKPLPAFFEHKADAAALSHWTEGAKAPKALKELLPNNAEYLPASIIQPNEPGVIKQNAGGFVPLRVAVDVRGRRHYTNIGIPADALFRNKSVQQDRKTLIPPDAKAIIVYRHGGGTIGTGHHVATQIAAFFRPYGIYVVGYDHANHAMGPRALTNEAGRTSAEADVEFGYEFIRQHLAPSGVPIFLSGHSMGGVYSIAEMVMFDKVFREPRVAALIRGFIPLSPVLDGTPYRDPKFNLNSGPKDGGVAPAEVGLFKSFTLAGKLQPLCDIGCSPLTYSLNLDSIVSSRRPGSGRAANIPALIIVGTGDFLYAPFREAWTRLETTPNIEVYKMDQRISLLSKSLSDTETVGHLLMDFMAPISVSNKEILGTRKNNEVSRIVDAITLGYTFSGSDVMTLYRANVIPLELVHAMIKKSGYYEEQQKLRGQQEPGAVGRKKTSVSEIVNLITRSKPGAVGEWRKMIFAFLKDHNHLNVAPFVSDVGDVRTPEPFLVIKDFVERSLKITLKKTHAESGGILPLILTEWMRNLAFRAFVENFSGVRKISSMATANMTPLAEAAGKLVSAATNPTNSKRIGRVRDSLNEFSRTNQFPLITDVNAVADSLKKYLTFLREFKKVYLEWKSKKESQSQMFGFSADDRQMLQVIDSLIAKLVGVQESFEAVLGQTSKDPRIVLQLESKLNSVLQDTNDLVPILVGMQDSIARLFKSSYLPESRSDQASRFSVLIAEQDRLAAKNRLIRKASAQRVSKQTSLKAQLKKYEYLLKVAMTSADNVALAKQISELSVIEKGLIEFADNMNRSIKLYLGKHHLGHGEFDIDVYSNIPPELKRDFQQYQVLLAKLREKEKRVDDLYGQLMRDGDLAEVEVPGSGFATGRELMNKVQSIKSEMESIARDTKSDEAEFSQNYENISELELEKGGILGKDSYVTYQTLSLMPILNGGPHSEGLALEVWSHWVDNVWGNRIPESSFSYY